MLSQKMEKELNNQVNAEMYSAYLYLAMSAYFEDQNLSGFANWMYVQAQEEMTHAMKIYRFIFSRGGKVDLKAIEEPPKEWDDAVKVAEEVYEHEQKVTGMIHNLVNLAREEKDYGTDQMLQWFVSEQVEEEDNADELLQQLKLIGGKGQGLLMLDRELAARQFVDETQQE
ncbi:MAG TPA: ferritin [Bacteroidales bacterium]|nr:ferritin [Bacteroidales bacterium]